MSNKPIRWIYAVQPLLQSCRRRPHKQFTSLVTATSCGGLLYRSLPHVIIGVYRHHLFVQSTLRQASNGAHRKVSALSGLHCATYFLQTDALRPALPLWDIQLHHTSAAHQVRRAGFSFSGPASWNSLSPCWTIRAISNTSVFKNKFKNLSFKVSIQHSVDYQSVFMHPRLFCVGFMNFYCSAPMFLR